MSRGESVEIGGGFRVPEVMEQSGARLVDVGTTNRTRLADYRRAVDAPDRRRPRAQGAPEQLPRRRLRRGHAGRRAGDARAARRRRPRQRPARRHVPVVARAAPAAVAGRRAGRRARRSPPAPRSSRSAATSCSAARRPGSSPGAPTSSRAAPATRWPAPCGPAGSCSPRCRTSPSPTSAATSSRRSRSGGWRRRRSTSSPPGRGDRRRHRQRGDRHRGAPRRRVGARHDDPVVRRRRRRRPPRRAAGPRPAGHRQGDGEPDRARPARRRAGRRRRARRRARSLRGEPVSKPSMRVIATAGHVDHGKSSLVLALTGTDPDRFDEEKRRGLTIDLGFAHPSSTARRSASSTCPATCGSCATCSPASAASTPACSSSPRPRAGSRRARSTCGSSSWSASPTASSRSPRSTCSTTTSSSSWRRWRSPSTSPARSSPAPRSSRSRRRPARGRPAGRALAELARRTPAAADRGRPRLWIDRVFAAKGSGTVVTGTLTDGSLATDAGRRRARSPAGPGPRDPDARRAVERIGPATASPSTSPGSITTPSRAATPSSPGLAADRAVRRLADRAPQPRPRRVAARRLPRLRRLRRARRAAARARPRGVAPRRDRLGPAAPADGRAAAAARRPLRAARDRSRRDGRRRRGARRRPGPAGVRARPDRRVERVVAERGWVDADELER